jgi:hypothetical protein
MNNLIVDEKLIGLDHETTVNAYYIRDTSNNVDNISQIIGSLKKLGYYENNDNSKINFFCVKKLINLISNELTENWDNNIKEQTIDYLLTNIRDSIEINEYQDKLNNISNKQIYLSRFLNTGDLYEFYKNLTLQELNDLGY